MEISPANRSRQTTGIASILSNNEIKKDIASADERNIGRIVEEYGEL